MSRVPWPIRPGRGDAQTTAVGHLRRRLSPSRSECRVRSARERGCRDLAPRYVARLVGELVQEILRLQIQPRRPELIRTGTYYGVESRTVRLDRHRPIITR